MKHKVYMCVILVLAILLNMVSPLPVTNAARGGDADDSVVVVSMGDSYSSGEGLSPFIGQNNRNRQKNQDWLSHRSQRSWPGRLQVVYHNKLYTLNEKWCAPGTKNEDVSWYFTAVSGATTLDLLGETKMTKEDKTDPQYDLFHGPITIDSQIYIFDKIEKGSVDYVTLTIGGNDVHFADIIYKCATTSYYQNPNKLKDYLTGIWDIYFHGEKGKGKAKEKSVQERLHDTYVKISEKAGTQAKIKVVGYPTLLSEGKFISKKYKFDEEEVREVNSAVILFNEYIEEIVERCREEGIEIYFVSVEKAFEGHEAYTDNPFINEVIFQRGWDLHPNIIGNISNLISAGSMHPNGNGAQAYAKEVQKKLDTFQHGGGGRSHNDLPLETPTPLATCTPTADPTNTPTPTPSPSPTPTPTNAPTSIPKPTPVGFQETGETMYGDLTDYIGMTAEEVIVKIGKPYRYEIWTDTKDGATGAMSFDEDVSFVFYDSGLILNTACVIGSVHIHVHCASTWESGIIHCKNIGNGLTTYISNTGLFMTQGIKDVLEYEEDAANPWHMWFKAQYGGYQYLFGWGVDDARYDFGEPPAFISISDLSLIESLRFGEAGLIINSGTFPDRSFREYVLENIDKDKNGWLSEEERKNVKEMDVAGKDIYSLAGIGYFPNLEILHCGSYRGPDELWRENHLDEVDVSENPLIKELDCGHAAISRINVRGCSKLEELWLYACSLDELDLSDCTNLKVLNVEHCWHLKKLDLRNNKMISELYVESDVQIIR